MFEQLRAAIAAIYGRVQPEDERLWHKWPAPLLPTTTIDGARITIARGQTWRRRRQDGRYEWRQDLMTAQEMLDNHW